MEAKRVCGGSGRGPGGAQSSHLGEAVTQPTRPASGSEGPPMVGVETNQEHLAAGPGTRGLEGTPCFLRPWDPGTQM